MGAPASPAGGWSPTRAVSPERTAGDRCGDPMPGTGGGPASPLWPAPPPPTPDGFRVSRAAAAGPAWPPGLGAPARAGPSPAPLPAPRCRRRPWPCTLPGGRSPLLSRAAAAARCLFRVNAMEGGRGARLQLRFRGAAASREGPEPGRRTELLTCGPHEEDAAASVEPRSAPSPPRGPSAVTQVGGGAGARPRRRDPGPGLRSGPPPQTAAPAAHFTAFPHENGSHLN